jgi:hypothetical protein
VPFGIVCILIVMGRRLADNAGTEMIGVLVIWGGLAAVALVDAALVRLGVAR